MTPPKPATRVGPETESQRIRDRVPTRSVTPRQRRRTAAESAEDRRRRLAALGITKRLRVASESAADRRSRLDAAALCSPSGFLHKHACCCSTCTHTSFCHTTQLAYARPTLLCIRLVIAIIIAYLLPISLLMCNLIASYMPVWVSYIEYLHAKRLRPVLHEFD